MISSVINTAGEPEREARSRRENVIEALGLATAIFAVLWPYCFGWGVLGGSRWVRDSAEWLTAGFGIWVLAISPFWHRDSAESLGLGNPRRLWRMLRERRGVRRWRLALVVVALFAALFFTSLANWPDTAGMFHLGAGARLWGLTPAGTAKAAACAFVMSAFVTTCLVRYDNFLPAFRVALAVSAALILFAGTAALLHRGPAAFARFDPWRYPLDVLAYVFWGALQQFVFTSYFATRLRKGFAPAQEPANVIPRERRLRAVLLGGALAAATFAPALWLAMRQLYGAQRAPLALLGAGMAFAFPAGAAWTFWFCRDKRRMLVATLSGAFFGLIHLDSYGLVLMTFGLGTILAHVFMQDRYRNLSALGFIHGFLGSTFGKMFNKPDAGVLHVDYRVGPWNVDEPALAVLILPLLCCAGFAALLAWAWRRVP